MILRLSLMVPFCNFVGKGKQSDAVFVRGDRRGILLLAAYPCVHERVGHGTTGSTVDELDPNGLDMRLRPTGSSNQKDQ